MSDVNPPDPNAAWSPEELTEELSPEEVAAIKQQLPLLDEVITWFDGQIALYSNPEIITGVNPSSSPEDVKSAVMFAQTMIAGYKEKRKEFASRFKQQIAQVTPPKE